MTGQELREKYIQFFKDRDHQQIPSAPLVLQEDPTTLFTSSGMQPLVPYLLGETHPLGRRLVNSQICFRAEDLEEVGDNRHTTFFEMLGNWSLGDYFKKDQLKWFFNFLTQVVKLDPDRLYITVFEGNQQIPKDEQSIKIWQQLLGVERIKPGKAGFDPQVKLYTYGADKNWWSRAGGPGQMPVGGIGGPDSEIFYDFGPDLNLHQQSAFKDQVCHPNCDCGRFLEIGNSVFMEYQKTKTGFKKLPQQNVDFGGGLERILAAKLNSPDVFKTDLFFPLVQAIEKHGQIKYLDNRQSIRIIVDHLKAAVFMVSEGLKPSNKAHGYILRRLLRRAAVKMDRLKQDLEPTAGFQAVGEAVVDQYRHPYFPQPAELKQEFKVVISQEMTKFNQTLRRGLREVEAIGWKNLDAQSAFDLFQTYGLPWEITEELAAEKGLTLDKQAFEAKLAEHKKKSRLSAKKMFKGGLADHSEAVTKLHTATHLLHASLRKVLGEHVQQTGSNIKPDRLRFDFTHPQKMTKQELEKVESLVNQQIEKDLAVESEVVSLAEAKKQGALAFFDQEYPDKVKVYRIGSFSREVCAGPHVDFTSSLGRFRIKKEESCGAGKRRIYAVLETSSKDET